MIAILTTDPSLFESLRAGLNLSSSGPDGVARGHGFTLTCRSDGDVRGLLDEAVESSWAETMIFAAIADSVSSDHETGDVVLPNVILPPDSSDGQALPPIFLDLYPDQDDLLYEDSFGLSIGGIALDAVLLDKPSEEDMNRLRSSQADAILDRLYSIVATHRVGGYESVFLPVLALRKRDSRSNIDPADSLGRTISFLRDSFA